MKFYNRENELAELKRIQRLSFEENSRLTVITGRRRIGKTSLIMKAVDEMPTVYLFMKLLSVVSLSPSFRALWISLYQQRYGLSVHYFNI